MLVTHWLTCCVLGLAVWMRENLIPAQRIHSDQTKASLDCKMKILRLYVVY